MIFKIEREVFLKEPEFILNNLKRITDYSSFLTIISEGLTENDRETFHDFPVLSSRIEIYSNTVDCDDKTENISSEDFINSVTLDTKQEIIDYYYIQRIKQFSGMLPLSNNYIIIDKNYNLFFGKEKIGSFKEGIFYNKLKYDNLLTLKGRYSTVLNPLYDFTKIGNDLPDCVDIKECEFKDELLEKVSDEVKKVNQEQLIYLCELMTNVNYSQEKFIEVFNKMSELKNGENQ